MKSELATMKRFDAIIMTVVVGILAASGGFLIGHYTFTRAISTASTNMNNSSGSIGTYGPGGGGFRRGGGFGVHGIVASVSGSTVIITTRNGSTDTIDVSSSTTYLNSDGSTGTLADVTIGATILVVGQTSNGATNATRILINPQAGGFGGGSSAPDTSGQVQTN